MTDESVGKIQLDIEISKGSINGEIGSFNKAFGNSFKNVFSSMTTQTSRFVKNTIGGIANSFKSFAQVGNSSNQEVAQSSEEIAVKIRSLTEQMENATNRAELHRQKIKELQAEYSRLSGAGMGDTPQAKKLQEQILKNEASMLRYANASDNTRTKIEKLEQSTQKAKNTTKEAGKQFEKAGVQAQKSGKKINGFATMLNRSFMRILRRIFIYNLIYKAIRGLINYINSALKTNKEYSKSLNLIKTNLRVAFQPIYDFILPAINALMRALATATTYIAASISAMFGKTYKQSYDAAKSLDVAKKKMDGYGKATKKTQNALAGFDEINQLDIQDEETSGGSKEFEMTMPDIDTSKTEDAIARITSVVEGFYNNWGMRDILEGIKEGLRLVSFDSIRENFKIAFSGLGEIARTYLESMQPVYQAAGQAMSTFFKNGIAIAGNVFEPISLGWANFVTNMQSSIQDWIIETSGKVVSGFNNLNIIFEVIGQSWLDSINKYKPNIAKAVEDTLTNTTGTLMLIGTVFTDTFEIIAGKVREFVEENKVEIQKLTDSIVQIFTDGLDFVNKIWSDVLGSLKSFWDNWGKGIVDGAIIIVTDVAKWMLYLWNDLLRPLWDKSLGWLKKIWDENLKGIVDELLEFVGRVGELMILLWDKLIKPHLDWLMEFVVPHIKTALGFIIDATGVFVNSIAGFIKGLLQIINGIIDFLIGIFTGDWERAWEGIKNIFKSIWDNIIMLIPNIQKDMTEKFKEAFEEYKQIGHDMFNMVWEGMKNIWDGITSWVSEKVNWLKDKLMFWKKGQDEMTSDGGGSSGGGSGQAGVQMQRRAEDMADNKDTLIKYANKNGIEADMGTLYDMWKAEGAPKLARGGIIDQPTLAMVGERGREAVIPFENSGFLEALTGSIISAFAQLLPLLQGSNNSSYDENRELVFNIDGVKLIRILLPKLNDELVRMGYRPIYQYE